MDGAFFAALVVGGFVWFWICIGLGKRIGDQLASWVIAHEQDDNRPAPEFGVEWVRSGNDERASLRAYRPYAARYRKLRRARGEDVTLARQFDAIYYAQFGGLALALSWLLVVFLMQIF